MYFKILNKNDQQKVTKLFTSVFSASEGEEEGKLIGKLASELSLSIDNDQIICFGAYENESLIGSIFFTRLRFNASVLVYLLAPVAVSTKHQGQGVGQALISYGLDELKNRSVAVAITYGDPSFYTKVGFQPLSENVIQAPLPLSMPGGWLGQSLIGQSLIGQSLIGQSLIGEPIQTINGRPTCVEPFNDPAYW